MVNVWNTITGETDNLPNHLAVSLIRRSNGLWTDVEVHIKPKRRKRRTREQIDAGVSIDDVQRAS